MIELTADQAVQIKQWRVEYGCSWRRVAELIYEDFPELRDKIVNGSQISGIELCNSAQNFFNESNEQGWN